MANTFKVGDTAYFEEYWTERIIGGKVIEVGMTKATEKYSSKQFVKIRIEDSRETRDQLSEKCYQSREAAQAAKDAEDEAIRNKYREQIQTIEDLVIFMYNNNVYNGAEEYTDWNARQVACEKAKELLCLELD